MSMTVGEIQMANRAIGCAERIADALEGIQSVMERQRDERWKAAAKQIAALYEKRGEEWSLNNDEVSALMTVAKLSKTE